MRKRPQHRCFPVKFEKFLRIPILKNMCDWLLLLCGSCGASQVLHWSKNTAGVEILVRVDHDFIDFYRDSMKFYLWFYNHFHNTLRLFDVLPNFLYTTSETMRDCYLQTWHIRVASRTNELRLRKFFPTASSPPEGGHAYTRKKRLSLVPSLHAKIKIFLILEKSSSKTETFAIVRYFTRKPGSVSDILWMIVASPPYPFHTLHCGEFSTQFPKTLFPKTKRLYQCVKFYNMRNSIKLFVENHIKGELHSNYIFLYFVLFGLEWDSVNLFTRMNFFFLAKLTFEHHLHKTYIWPFIY